MNNSSLKFAAFLSYVQVALSIVISFFFTPFLLRFLGRSEYGLYILIASIISVLSIFDFGLHNTTYRYISKYRAENDSFSQSKFLGSTFLFYIILSFVLSLFIMFLYHNFEFIFTNSLTSIEIDKAKLMLIFFSINLIFTIFTGAFESIIKGYGQFVLTNYIGIFKLLARTILIFVLLNNNFDSLAIIVVDTFLNLIFGFIIFIYIFFILKVSLNFSSIDFTFFSEILVYSFSTFLIALVSNVFWKTGEIILGITSNTFSVTLFSISLSFIIYYQQFSVSISHIFLPKVSLLIKEKKDKELFDLYIRVSRTQLSILGLLLVGFTIFGFNFIKLWLGIDYIEVFWISLFFLYTYTLPLIQSFGSVILQAKNKQSKKSMVYLAMGTLNIVFAYTLGNIFSLQGVAFATGLSIVIFLVFAMNYIFSLDLKINLSEYFKKVFFRIIPVMLFTLFFGGFLQYFFNGAWINLIFNIIIVIIFYTLFVVFYAFNKDEKSYYLDPIINVFRGLNKND